MVQAYTNIAPSASYLDEYLKYQDTDLIKNLVAQEIAGPSRTVNLFQKMLDEAEHVKRTPGLMDYLFRIIPEDSYRLSKVQDFFVAMQKEMPCYFGSVYIPREYDIPYHPSNSQHLMNKDDRVISTWLQPAFEYNEVKSKLIPGSYVLVEGSESIFSKTIIDIQNNELDAIRSKSHSGNLINTDFLKIKNGIPGEMYIMESTMSGIDGVHNTETGGWTFGPQIRSFRDVVNIYSEDRPVAVYNVLNSQFTQKRDEKLEDFHIRSAELRDRVTTFWHAAKQRGYEKNVVNLAATAVGWMRYFRGKDMGLSCIELSMDFGKNFHALPSHINIQDVCPQDIIGYDIDNDRAYLDSTGNPFLDLHRPLLIHPRPKGSIKCCTIV